MIEFIIYVYSLLYAIFGKMKRSVPNKVPRWMCVVRFLHVQGYLPKQYTPKQLTEQRQKQNDKDIGNGNEKITWWESGEAFEVRKNLRFGGRSHLDYRHCAASGYREGRSALGIAPLHCDCRLLSNEGITLSYPIYLSDSFFFFKI